MRSCARALAVRSQVNAEHATPHSNIGTREKIHLHFAFKIIPYGVQIYLRSFASSSSAERVCGAPEHTIKIKPWMNCTCGYRIPTNRCCWCSRHKKNVSISMWIDVNTVEWRLVAFSVDDETFHANKSQLRFLSCCLPSALMGPWKLSDVVRRKNQHQSSEVCPCVAHLNLPNRIFHVPNIQGTHIIRNGTVQSIDLCAPCVYGLPVTELNMRVFFRVFT